MTYRSASGDDLNLSLTGSQILTPPGKRSSSAHLRRPNSLVDVRTTKTSNRKYTSGTESDAEKKKTSRTRNLSTGTPPPSYRSEVSSVGMSAGNASRKPKTKETDFLALFESSHQPKIRRPTSATNTKNKKTAANPSKVLWDHSSMGRKPAGVANSARTNTTLDTDRTEPHNIFQPETTNSSSDEIEDIEESLSRSINKLQSLQNQLSGVNRNNSSFEDPEVLNSQRSDASTRHLPMNSIANNMTSQGLMPRTRPSLSSMENSYQNIKPKAPVNQVRKPTSNQIANHQNHIINATSNQVGLNVAEDYIQTLNSSASKIQLWFRRHQKRRRSCQAALKRMLDHKKKEHEDTRQSEKSLSLLESVDGGQVSDRKKIREDRARKARQQAIEDLHKRREEKREMVKQKAEQEVLYLQASGKISKSITKTSIGKKKAVKAGVKKDVSKETATPEESPRDRIDPPKVTTEMEGFYESSPRQNGAEAAGESARDGETASRPPTRTTLNDLFDTLKKLEEEETLVSARQEKKNSWLGELTKSREGGEWGDTFLTAENIQKLNSAKDGLSKSGFLTDDKLQSIMSFLDEVQVNDRLTEIDSEINKMNEELEKPALLMPSGEEMAQMEQAQAVASEVTSAVLSQRLEIDEKKHTITMLQKALNQQRELTVRHAKETEKEMKRRLEIQKDEYEETVKRHLSFIDQLIEDKKTLSEKCEQLVKELKGINKKFEDKFKAMDENHSIEITKLKDISAATEKLRREKWIDEKTKKIKEMTVKGLEPEIQRLIAKHKSEMKKIKQIQEAELLESDERAAQRYVKMTEELRDQLAEEKEAACARERQLAMERYEKQLQQEEQAYQQQRRRLYTEVQEEKDRLSQQAIRQRTEVDKLQRQLEDSHTHALEAMKSEFEKAREEQDKRHSIEIRELHERLRLEKESWEENYMKKKETWLTQKERELKDQVRKDRDKEIDMVIGRLEEDATSSREELERTAENKIRRMREKYNSEVKELDRSERESVKKYNEIKAKMTEVEGENERLKVIIRQKDLELADNKRLTEKLHEERGHVSDIIRQEFADRIVQTEEESKRVKMEMAELKAKHRIEIDRGRTDVEDMRRQKDEEMEEVHKRVKQAIVKKEEVVQQLRQQYQAAMKRADHLEGLLEQQRKQLLKK